MGKYYALAQGEDEAVAAASEDHYKPLGPGDSRADRSGVHRGRARRQDRHAGRLLGDRREADGKQGPVCAATGGAWGVDSNRCLEKQASPDRCSSMHSKRVGSESSDADDAASTTALPIFFLADRLKVQLREQGARHDLVDAVFSLEGQDDLVLIVRRVEALGKFLDTEDGKNLLAGYKRATNIIRIEEKKDKREYAGTPDPKLYRAGRGAGAGRGHRHRQERKRPPQSRMEDFDGAMRAMAKLAPACRCLLRQGHGQCRRPDGAREPAEAAQRNPRGHARGGGFLEDRRVACSAVVIPRRAREIR